MDPLHLAILIGGPPDRAPAERVAERAYRRGDLEVDLIDLTAACLPEVPPCGLPTPSAVRDLVPWLAAADGFVVVVPERRSGPLVNAPGWYADQLRAKPVAFLGHGGARPAERRLRALFAAVPAVTVREAAGFGRRDTDRVLDELAWWARPLREARAKNPYPPLQTP
ncbi:NAD(P)H-dependent oxidoreductase [Thermomonospora umbrina]|uniref:NADPH-dependent FMN reductase n=1 Tax=Thermomonospora umbrina TaxID=111806 RepID=A0A3D9SWE5_9ACTN|nr:NAD(P)H-dependent oxidoreductase [Thermomonospora umbrina]REE98343.1 NADPH-dependent FMN reductase [Thermomonospora umbrina]